MKGTLCKERVASLQGYWYTVTADGVTYAVQRLGLLEWKALMELRLFCNRDSECVYYMANLLTPRCVFTVVQ